MPASSPYAPTGEALDLSGQSALVTGANQGIGREIALTLAAHGARVAINYPDPATRPEALDAFGTGAVAVQGDVGSTAEIARLFEEVDRAFDRLDILVNNAGIFPRASVFELDEVTWDRVLAVNLKGTFFCSQQAARRMSARRSGAIVNIASKAAVDHAAGAAAYAAAKAAAVAMIDSLAADLKGTGECRRAGDDRHCSAATWLQRGANCRPWSGQSNRTDRHLRRRRSRRALSNQPHERIRHRTDSVCNGR